MRVLRLLLVSMLRSPSVWSRVVLVSMLHRRIQLPGNHLSGVSSSISVMACVCVCAEVDETRDASQRLWLCTRPMAIRCSSVTFSSG